MGIIQGITGGISGKMGSAVFRQRHGETVISQYQPKVANPKSDAQTLQRARFKLVSQLGSILDGFIAIPRDGAVSARNQFAQLNNDIVVAKVGGGVVLGAQIELTQVKLTRSAVPFGSLSVIYESIGNSFAVSGFGTLAVTNRPERRRANTRAAAASSAVVTVVIIESPMPVQETYLPPRVVAFGTATPDSDGIFTASIEPISINVHIDIGSNKYVALAYETLPVSASTEERFNDIIAENTTDTAIAVVSFAKSVNYQDIITSDTIGVNVSEGR